MSRLDLIIWLMLGAIILWMECNVRWSVIDFERHKDLEKQKEKENETTKLRNKSR